MALVSLRQLLDHAAENNYGIPAFNVNNLEQVQAIMQAADEVNAPVIMQASAGARKYAGEIFLEHLIKAAIESYPHIPVCMHQDHGQSPAVCQGAINLGFSSVMMDGSLMSDGTRKNFKPCQTARNASWAASAASSALPHIRSVRAKTRFS